MAKTNNPMLAEAFRQTAGGLVADAKAKAAVGRSRRKAQEATEKAMDLLSRALDGDETVTPQQIKAAESILDRGGCPKSSAIQADVAHSEAKSYDHMTDAELDVVIAAEEAEQAN